MWNNMMYVDIKKNTESIQTWMSSQPEPTTQSENLPILHHGCAIDQMPNVSQEIEVARPIWKRMR